MASKNNDTKLIDTKGWASSGGRKLYPMTEEIYERGEKIFQERLDQLLRERHPDKVMEDSEDI